MLKILKKIGLFLLVVTPLATAIVFGSALNTQISTTQSKNRYSKLEQKSIYTKNIFEFEIEKIISIMSVLKMSIEKTGEGVSSSDIVNLTRSKEFLPLIKSFSSVLYVDKVKNSDLEASVREMKQDKNIPVEIQKGIVFHPSNRSSQENLYLVKYVSPLEDRYQTLAYDYGSDITRLALIERAEAAGDIQISPVITSAATKTPIIIMLVPLKSPERKPKAQYLVLIINANELLEKIYDSSMLDGYAITIGYSDKSNIAKAENYLLKFGSGPRPNTAYPRVVMNTTSNIHGSVWDIQVQDFVPRTWLENSLGMAIIAISTLLGLTTSGVFYLLIDTSGRARRIAEGLNISLKESEDLLQTIAKYTADGIIMIDDKEKIVFWNMAMEKIFGYKDSEVLNKNYREVVKRMLTSDKDISDYFADVEKYYKTGKSEFIEQLFESEMKNKNGEKMQVETYISAVNNGGRIRLVGILRNVSEQAKKRGERDEYMKEIEKMNQLMVDREIRISELKNKVTK